MNALQGRLAAVSLALLPALARGAPAATQAVAASNNEFAVDLYKRLAAAKGNVFCSPYSISSALAMTFAGARGETARQMTEVLRLRGGPDALHAGFGALASSLDEAAKKGKVKLSSANALWGQKDFGFDAAYLALTRRYYRAGLHELDFRSDPEGGRKTINAWIEGQTQNKIKDLIATGVLNKETRLVLTNAIYFKGSWASPFQEDATQLQPFYRADGGQGRAALMHQTKSFGYFETAEIQGLELGYAGGRLSMVVLLPRKNDGLAAMEAGLTEKELSGWLARLSRRSVNVYLPSFKTTSEFGLNSALADMGMKAAFTPAEADFSGMDGKRDLFLSAAIHKAFIDVNEEGTEAAAATGISVGALAAISRPPPVFRADHPFLFLIRDKDTGSILFLGRLSEMRE